MTNFALSLLLVVVVVLAVGCELEQTAETHLPDIPTLAVVDILAPTVAPLEPATPLPSAPTLAPYQDAVAGPTLAPFPTLAVTTPQPAAAEPLTDAELMYDALDKALDGDPLGVEVLAATGRAEFIPALVEFLRFPWYYSSDEVNDAVNYSLKELAGVHLDTAEFDYLNADWPDWLEYIGSNPDLRGPEGFTGWKGELFSRLVDPATGAFLYDGAPATIRVEEIAWGGVPKDGIPDLTNPPVIPGNQAEYLHDNERVFGVSFNGHHRAYPHRILNPHEMANDEVGGVNFALAY